MACSENNPCGSNPCNDLYNNCGCPNPNTFGCTTYEGSALPCTGILNGEEGNTVLAKIEDAVCDAQSNQGKVLLDGTDTCPEYLFDKLEEGLNISFSISGTGCDRKIVINAVEGGVPVDVNAKVSVNDTTSGYLNDKIEDGTYIDTSIVNSGGNEKLHIDVNVNALVSSDSGNQLTIGADGGLKTAYSAPDGSETKIIEGVGVTITGTGTSADQYIISTNPSIQVARPCFDGIWKNITLVAVSNPSVVYASGNPQYRYRFDGSIEFKGQVTYTVAFGTYQTSTRKHTVNIATFPTICVTSGELAGVSDLKGINYIDIPQASADQIVQQYGYIIRKSVNSLIVEFQSSFTGATSKSIVVNFEGCVIHPNL